MEATRIDWVAVAGRMAGQPWTPGVSPDPDAGPYEKRRVKVLEESEVPAEGLVEVVDAAAAHGYTAHCPPGDGLWVSETRYPPSAS